MKRIGKIWDLICIPLGFLIGFILITDRLYVFMSNIAEYSKYTVYETIWIYVFFFSMILYSRSLIRHLVLYNASARQAYLAREDGISDLSYLFRRKSLYLYAAAVAAVYVFAPLNFSFNGLYQTVAIFGNFADKLISLAILLAVLSVTGVTGALSAYKTWRKDPDPENYKIVRQILSAAGMIAAYFTGPVILARLISSAVGIISLMESSTLIQITSLIAALITAAIAWIVIRVIHKRRKFIKELKKSCANGGAVLSKIRQPYLSGFIYNDKENFRVTVGEKTYSCKFISCRRRRIPLVILKNGDIGFKYIIRLRGVVIYNFSTIHKTSHKADCNKIMILNPVPKVVYAATGTKLELLDNGMCAGGYRVFTGGSFIRALELDALDKD